MSAPPRGLGIARSALRIAIGLLFIGHGGQKLFGWFGGGGLPAAEAEMQALGLRPARATARVAAASQLGAGGLAAVGLCSPAAYSVIAANMITVMRTANRGKGPWGKNGGWEYPLVLTLAVGALAEGEPDPLSLDRALGRESHGLRWAAFVLGAALAGSMAATAISRAQRAEEAAEPQEESPS